MEILSAPNPVPFDLPTLLEQQSVAAFYQPIVSIKKGSVVGLETLGRGVDPEGRQLIEPETLFQASGPLNKSLDLDRLLRHKGLEGFKEIQAKMPGLVLFLSLETSVLTREVVGSGHLLDKVQALGLAPNSIVIELSRSSAADSDAVKKFVDFYRNANFLISLKDLDESRASLDRIFHLNPDVLKTAPSMTSALSKDSYKRDCLRSLVSLSHRMGGLIVANGIENEEDALAALELGVDMLQGGYFSKHQRTENSTTLGLKARIVFLGARFKRQLNERFKRDKDRKAHYEKIAGEITAQWMDVAEDKLESKFAEILKSYPQLECLYLLNQDGIQVTETVLNSRKFSDRKKYLFQPAPKGTDHSLKDYYYSLVYNNLERYFTEPYVSLASGNPCVTAALLLKGSAEKKPHILCLDIDVTKMV